MSQPMTQTAAQTTQTAPQTAPSLPTQHPALASVAYHLPVLALLYVRVSSDEQAREGVSLPTQIATTRQYASAMGWQIGDTYQDILSGTKDARPGYVKLLADVRAHRKAGRRVTVVVVRLDRFGRRLLERVRAQQELRELGVPFHSIKEGGEVSPVVSNVMAALAEEEVRQLGERVSDSFRGARAKGWPAAGQAPWGYVRRASSPQERSDGALLTTLEPSPAEAPFVVRAFEMAAAGESLHAISRWVAGLPPEARGPGGGRRLAYSNVRLAILSPVYIGRPQPPRLPGGQRPSPAATLAQPVGRWAPLVSDDLWARAQAAIADHARVPKQGGRFNFVLSGLLRCPACGGRLSGATLRNPGPARADGTRPVYATRRYVCEATTRGGASRSCRASVHADSLEADVRRQAGALLDAFLGDDAKRRAARESYELLRRPQSRAGAEVGRKLAGIEAKVTQAQAAIVGATEKYVVDKITESQYRALTEKLEADLRRLEAERRALLTDQQAQAAAPDLPDFDALLAEARDWQRGLSQGDAALIDLAGAQTTDPQAVRGGLVALIDHLVPEKAGYARYTADIAWTPKGKALAAAAGLAEQPVAPAQPAEQASEEVR